MSIRIIYTPSIEKINYQVKLLQQIIHNNELLLYDFYRIKLENNNIQKKLNIIYLLI